MQQPAVNDPEWVDGSSATEDESSDGEVSSADTMPISIPSKFLLTESSPLHDETGPTMTVDSETKARLEGLLKATGLSNFSLESRQFNDPEVLRRLTTSVSSALDEAAAALNRMRVDPAQSGHNHMQNGLSTCSSSRGNGGGGGGDDDEPSTSAQAPQTPPATASSSHQQQITSPSSSAPSSQSSPSSPSRNLVDACMDGDITTVKKLLNGDNVNHLTEEGESLLSLACASGYFELAQLLLVMRANIEERGMKDTTPLMEAANAGYYKIVRLLLSHGADVNAKTQQGNTALMFACSNGFEDVVGVLLEAGANAEAHNENGHTPLMEAASAGQVGVAKLLVKHGAQINSHSNEFKESALTLACYKGHLEMVRFLLAAGADREHKTDEMHTALMEASMDGHVEVARLLLDSGAQVNMPQDSFESPLTLAASGGHVELAQLLLDRGANIEEVNDEGYTPLMESAREGHEEMVALLLSQGADINAQTEETQETALTLACCGGFLEVTDFLIKAGAELELGASTPLMEAAQEGHLELVRFLIGAGAGVNACTATYDTALTYACENGHTDVADLLLQAGSELEHESEGGRTPLMKAARAGNLCTVKFLLSKGADPNKKTTSNDHTPLSLACAGGHTLVAKLLLDAGADPSYRLKDNSSMIIEAAKSGHSETVRLLLEYRKSFSAPASPTSNTSLPCTSPGDKTCIQMCPSEEEKLLNKQHVLEELQKVERQYQEQVKTASKTNKQGFLTSLGHDAVVEAASFAAQENAEASAGASGLMVAAPPRVLQDEEETCLPETPTDCLSLDIDWHTESNHDTALTLACTGGHKDLVTLLLSKGADIEHRDKKGFTPLMLAATAGHAPVVEALLAHGAQMEAQSERTKDTALSLACSGGRQEVVEILLNHNANREHRNVSDYTPLSLAASGGYVIIIRLLLTHGAEINSRTGSKLGISPLMLAAMNGHTTAVRLLLDQGSDINAQIETNRNTALTLACFQGRHEVVSLLLDRKANVEHRAKTGLTPLMEAASGGYVEVGKVLLDKGADVNAPPVPSSRDTALTIAADKGHLRFVELLLERHAAVDVRNKKGNSPLWLACNGGHLDVVQKLVAAKADIDSQDNRKVSCLMAAFRKGHQKVVKWMVKHVTQFPSDQEMTRYIQTLSDKDLLKKCQVCMDVIHQAKERQALEANRNASSLLKALEEEKTREEQKKAAAARRREKKRLKKKAKQAPSKDTDDDEDIENQSQPTETRPPTIDEISNAGGSPTCIVPQRRSNHGSPTPPKSPSPTPVIRVEKSPPPTPIPALQALAVRKERKKNERNRQIEPVSTQPSNNSVALGAVLALKNLRLGELNALSNASNHHLKEEQPFEPVTVNRQRNRASPKVQASTSSLQAGREEGWKEVNRRTKKVTVPSAAISRVIGRAGCNINAIREVSGAYIEVEKQNPKCNQGERTVLIKGSAEATKQATNLIAGLAEDADADLMDVLQKCGLASLANKKIIQNHVKNVSVVRSPIVSSTTHSVIPSVSKAKVVVQPAPLPAQSAWGVPVVSALKSQSPLLFSISEPKAKKGQECSAMKSSSAPNIHQQAVKAKAPSPAPILAHVGACEPTLSSVKMSSSPTPLQQQPLNSRWQQQVNPWSGGADRSWSVNNGPIINGSSSDRAFSSVVGSAQQQASTPIGLQMVDTSSPSPRAVSTPSTISPRSEEDSLTKAPGFNRASSSVASSSVHVSPTSFRQQIPVGCNAVSAPCTPPFGSTSGPSSPTLSVPIDYNIANNNNTTICSSSSNNNNNKNHNNNLTINNNICNGSSTSVITTTPPVTVLPSVNGQCMPTLLDLTEGSQSLISSQQLTVGAGNGFSKFNVNNSGDSASSNLSSHLDVALGGVVGVGMYSNNNLHHLPSAHHGAHLGTMHYHTNQQQSHQDMNGSASNHLQANALGGPPPAGMGQHHHDRHNTPLPIGTERAQQRKTSAMPSANPMWNPVQQGLPSLPDVDRHWYSGSSYDPLTAGDHLLRSYTSHSGLQLGNEPLLNQIAAANSVLPHSNDMYHHLGHQMNPLTSSSSHGGHLPSLNGLTNGQGYMFGGDLWSTGSQLPQAPLHQPPPPHKPTIPNYNSSNNWPHWMQGGQQ